jgi:D-arabinose 1-dehydrogenase-like Zn-dependent alcohol dehydrogenase
MLCNLPLVEAGSLARNDYYANLRCRDWRNDLAFVNAIIKSNAEARRLSCKAPRRILETLTPSSVLLSLAITMVSEYTVFRGVEGIIKSRLTQKPQLGPKDILVRITHSGVCATDLAYVPYGIALGHEGVGIVEAIGSGVTQFKVGERAGGGYHRDSCGHCSYCLTARDIWCYERSIFGETDFNNGTFGEYYVGKETYLHKIPHGLASEHAAPLQCAGATTYNALVQVVKPGERVGIVGIGGLGHLAIQFAQKFGTEVVVFSTSKSKEDEAKKLGASEFYLFDGLEELQKPVNTLVVAGSKYPDWSKYVLSTSGSEETADTLRRFMQKNVLARGGNVIPLAAPHGPLTLPSVTHSTHWKTLG